MIRNFDSSDQRGHRVADKRNLHEEEDQDDACEADLSVAGAEFRRQKRCNNMGTIQRRHREQVENSEKNIHRDTKREHLQEKENYFSFRPFRHRVHGTKDGKSQAVQKGTCSGDKEIGNRTDHRDQDIIAAYILEITGIHRYGLRPSYEDCSGRQNRQCRNNKRTEEIKMGNGIQRQSPKVAGRRIPQAEGHPSMRHFVKNHGNQENRKKRKVFHTLSQKKLPKRGVSVEDFNKRFPSEYRKMTSNSRILLPINYGEEKRNVTRRSFLFPGSFVYYATTFCCSHPSTIIKGDTRMKRTFFALLGGLLFLVLTAGDCKKTSTEPGGGAPTVPTVTFSSPGQQDQCSQTAWSIIQFANAYSMQFSIFASLQPTTSGSDYNWQVTLDSLTISVKATRQGDGSFVWEIRYNGTEDGVTYSNKVMASGSTSADGKTGSFTAYDDSSPGVVGTFSWSTSASNVLTGTFLEKDTPGGADVYKIEIVSNANGSGEVTTSTWSGSAWVVEFHATWASSGGQATCS